MEIGFVGIIVKKECNVTALNEILSASSDLIVGRMGVPHHGDVNVIALIVEGAADAIAAMTAKLEGVSGIIVESAATQK